MLSYAPLRKWLYFLFHISVTMLCFCLYFRYDALCILLRHSKNVRYWFAHGVLFAYPNRFSEYLLECPSAEVRGAFAKLVVFIAHFSLQDGPCTLPFASPGPSSQVCFTLVFFEQSHYFPSTALFALVTLLLFMYLGL